MPPQQTAPRRRSLESMSMWALIITLIVGTLAFIPFAAVSLATTKPFLFAAGALITLALYILARLSRGNIIFPPVILVGALWLPAIAYTLSAAFSSMPFTSTLWGTAFEPDTLGFMLIAAVLGTLFALIVRRPEQYRLLLRVGALTFGVVLLVEVCVITLGQFMPNTISPTFSVVGSFNDLAFLLGLGIISTLVALRFFELSERARQALLIAGAVALFLLALANSSIVWTLVALVSLGLFVEAIMRRRSKTADADFDELVPTDDVPQEVEEGGRPLVWPLVSLAVALFFLIGGTLGGALASALHINVLNVRPSWQSTFSVARQTYATAPLFGTGPGTFGVEWLKYRDATLNSTVFWNVDFSSGIGFIPTSFVTTGIVGAVAWAVFLVLFVVLGLRMLILRAPEDAFVRYVATLSFLSALYLFAIAIFDLPSTVILVLAFVFTGLFVSTTRFATGSGQRGVIFSRSPRLGFVIVFSLTILLLASVASAYALVERFIATTELANAAAAFSVGDLDAADRAAQSSISFAPTAAAYQIEAGIAAARLSDIAASSTMPTAAAQQAFQTTLSAGVNAALTATRLAPSDYQNWLVLGNLYAQAVPLGHDSAKAAYEKAQALNPTSPQIPYILAQLEIANKNTAAAEDDLRAAIALKQDYTAAIFLLSQLEVKDGNVKDALASALAAAYFAPNDPNILFQVGILRAAENDYAGAATALAGAVNANPQFANARYFLAAVYAKQGDLKNALAQMQAIAALSTDNANAIAPQLTALEAGKNPFPANLLSISATPVKQ